MAAAVGCTRQQLARWLKLKSPLPRMRRGYDDGLARALKVDRNTLFYDWEVVDPEDAAMVITPAGLEVPWKFDDPAKAELVKAINQAVSSLPIQDIAAVLAFARSTREERLKVGEPGESQRRRDLLVLPPIRLRKKQ